MLEECDWRGKPYSRRENYWACSELTHQWRCQNDNPRTYVLGSQIPLVEMLTRGRSTWHKLHVHTDDSDAGHVGNHGNRGSQLSAHHTCRTPTVFWAHISLMFQKNGTPHFSHVLPAPHSAVCNHHITKGGDIENH